MIQNDSTDVIKNVIRSVSDNVLNQTDSTVLNQKCNGTVSGPCTFWIGSVASSLYHLLQMRSCCLLNWHMKCFFVAAYK